MDAKCGLRRDHAAYRSEDCIRPREQKRILCIRQGKMYTSWDSGAHFSINVTSGLPTGAARSRKPFQAKRVKSGSRAEAPKQARFTVCGIPPTTAVRIRSWAMLNKQTVSASARRRQAKLTVRCIRSRRSMAFAVFTARMTLAQHGCGSTTTSISTRVQGHYRRSAHLRPRLFGGRGAFFGDPTLSGTYKITNRKSGLSLTVPGSSATAGTQLVQSAYSGGLNQQWNIIPNSNGTYRVKNNSSSQSVDVNGGSSADGAAIIQWTDHTGHNQEWILEPIGDGNYKMISKQTAKAITVVNASTVNGANIAQGTYTNDATTNDEWIIARVQ